MTDYLVVGTIKYKNPPPNDDEVGPTEWSSSVSAESEDDAKEKFEASVRGNQRIQVTEVKVTSVTDLTDE